jgi:hypothetical protein
MPHRIIEGTAFGPVIIKLAWAAFDEAWATIGPRFSGDAQERARLDLATAVISLLREDSKDVALVRDAAIREMRRKYPSWLGDVPGAGNSGTEG